ncbi:MAG TPA: hypothetical protein VMR41_00835 [Patescibacteria group bacterium]|nr:hypothetical protein [Patescibacteria group bacterium]
MKYIFITFSGLALPVALKLQQEGKEVIVGVVQDIKEYVMEEEVSRAKESDFDKKRRLELFKGMLDIRPAEKVVDLLLKAENPKDYFVFFDENNLYRWADKVRHLEVEGTFPTKEDYLFEIDRDAAKKFVKEHYPKLYTPGVKEFKKVSEALEFLQDTNELWVLKGRDDSANTFVPDVRDGRLACKQIVEMLENFPDKYEKLGFILEEYIPSIIELTPEIMYYDGVPLFTTIMLENKSFGSGNLSIQTGSAEDLVFPTIMEDRINKISFPPIIDEMAKKHKGLFIWDASLLINKKDGKMYFGEYCSNRPGYNSFFTELALCSSVHAFFEAIVAKKSPIPMGTVASSVRLFNLNRDDDEQVSADIAVDFLPEIEKDVWLWDVKKTSKGSLVTVGSDWNLAVITGAGRSIDEAVSRLYRNVEGFSCVGDYYRSKDDYLSLDYSTSILNRLNYGLERNLYSLPFDVKVGQIK